MGIVDASKGMTPDLLGAWALRYLGVQGVRVQRPESLERKHLDIVSYLLHLYDLIAQIGFVPDGGGSKGPLDCDCADC